MASAKGMGVGVDNQSLPDKRPRTETVGVLHEAVDGEGRLARALRQIRQSRVVAAAAKVHGQGVTYSQDRPVHLPRSASDNGPVASVAGQRF